MAIKHVITSSNGSIVVGTLVEELTEVIHVAMIDKIGPLPASVERTRVVYAYVLTDVWIARSGVEAYRVLNTMDAPSASTTWAEFWSFIPYDMTIMRDDVATITVVDNPSTSWNPPSEQ